MEVHLAPMLKVSTPYFRKFIRLYSPTTILWTEMLVCDFVINSANFRDRLLFLDENSVIQLGGSNPQKFVEAIKKLKKEYPFLKNYNINCGCPSDRVKSGNFGAVLMKQTELVAEIINQVHEKTGIILSVKLRNGVDEFDSYELFKKFIETIKEKTVCREFYVHARKCWLDGLSPSQNRTVPPIDYDYSYRIKEENRDLKIILNGQVKSKKDVKNLDGLMIGRAAMKNILVFNNLFQQEELTVEYKIGLTMKYLNSLDGKFDCEKGFPLNNIFKGVYFSKNYKIFLDEIRRQKLEIKAVISLFTGFFEGQINKQ